MITPIDTADALVGEPELLDPSTTEHVSITPDTAGHGTDEFGIQGLLQPGYTQQPA